MSNNKFVQIVKGSPFLPPSLDEAVELAEMISWLAARMQGRSDCPLPHTSPRKALEHVWSRGVDLRSSTTFDLLRGALSVSPPLVRENGIDVVDGRIRSKQAIRDSAKNREAVITLERLGATRLTLQSALRAPGTLNNGLQGFDYAPSRVTPHASPSHPESRAS